MAEALPWIRFGLVAVLVLAALAVFVLETAGLFRFRSMLTRMHATAMGDTAGLLAAALAAAVARGFSFASAKILLVWVVMAIAGPATSHLLARLECHRSGRGGISLPYEGDPAAPQDAPSSPEKGEGEK